MTLYNKYVLPKIVDCACRQTPAEKQREKVIPLAAGEVLEIGVGSGLNLPHYDAGRVARLTAIDPSPEMWAQRAVDVEELPFAVTFLRASAEAMPVDSNSVDTVITTYTLCTILDPLRALAEMRRVLKPGGQLIFCEHGRAPDAGVRRWQNFVNPTWRRFGGGCNLTRDIPALLAAGGFRAEQLEERYIPGWKPASYNFWGTAKP
jgi:ubiquinone/menaquinone biosynthesis C-methylase UbiE